MSVKTTTLATDPVLVQQHELSLTMNTRANNKVQTFSATILTYGATLTHLTCPDRWNQPQDVVLGFDHWQDYIAQANPGALNPYFGSIIGPTASRYVMLLLLLLYC
jgi:galactose mutarotase-like enzyme